MIFSPYVCVVLQVLSDLSPGLLLGRSQEGAHVVPVHVVVLLDPAETEGQLAHPVDTTAHT